MTAPVQINPYLTGNFAPIASEDDFQDLPITGFIPLELSGTFYRNGPNLHSAEWAGWLQKSFRPHAKMGIGKRSW